MQILFAISILCLIAFVLAGAAVARHIADGHRLNRSSRSSQDDFRQTFIHAAEDGSWTGSRAGLHQTIGEITAKKSWNQQPEIVTVRPVSEVRPESIQIASESLDGRRKAPQTSYQGSLERLDWAYFNKDMGDLTDPYQSPRLRANSRTSSKRIS